MMKYDELPVEDRLLFLDLLVSGKMNPKAPNKYLFSMATGKKYKIEMIDSQYYFEPCPIGYDKVNIKEEKAKQETAKKNEVKKRKYAVICDNQLCYLSDDFLIIRKDEREEIIDFGSQAVYSAYVYSDGAGTIYKESYIQNMVDKDQYLNKILKMKDYLIHLWDGDHLFDIAYL